MKVDGNKPMIDTVLNLLFRCSHRHLTRPITPVTKNGAAHGDTYVVCLDCAKQFRYDLKNMQLGKAIDHYDEASVVPTQAPRPRKTALKYAFGVGVPLAVLLGAAFGGRKPGKDAKPSRRDSQGR